MFFCKIVSEIERIMRCVATPLNGGGIWLEMVVKFILVPMGSAGDVHPFVWLGKLLQRRGHDVMMLAQEVIREIPERAGIRIVPVGDRATQERILKDPRLWNPRQAVRLLMEHIPTWARETIAAIEKEMIPGETALVAGALGFGARIASERWNLPLVTVHLQPQVFMSVEDMPVMAAGLEWMPMMPRWVRRGFVGLAHWQVDRALKGPVNALRREVGIEGEPVSGVMKQYWHSPDGVLCLFPEWFAKKAPDWPKQAVLTRFPLYDETGDRALDPAIEAFLQEGEKPVVLTAGSANSQAERFFREGVDACRLLGKRGILLTKFAEQLPTNLPVGVKYFEYAALQPSLSASSGGSSSWGRRDNGAMLRGRSSTIDHAHGDTINPTTPPASAASAWVNIFTPKNSAQRLSRRSYQGSWPQRMWRRRARRCATGCRARCRRRMSLQ